MPADRIFRPAIADLVPYEPGKPVEEVQRELGLERVVKLASNEGQFGPFPAAIEAIERGAHELHRYPDGGAYRLRSALAEKHDVEFDNVTLAAGADAVVMYLSLAVLDPGDEIVCGWPSFPSYVLDAVKMGAEARRVALTDYRYDVDAILDQVGERTKIVYVCHPNNPTGTTNTRDEIERYFERVPEHVLTVLDQAYVEYLDDPDYADGVELFKRGVRVAVLRTFSKIFGLAGLRIGWGVASDGVVTAVAKVRRAFDVNAIAQAAAIASIGDDAEVERRRRANAEQRGVVEEILRRHGFRCAAPVVANFVYAETGDDARRVFDALLREGVIVRPLHGFGAPTAIRVTVGTAEENALLDEALARVVALSGGIA